MTDKDPSMTYVGTDFHGEDIGVREVRTSSGFSPQPRTRYNIVRYLQDAETGQYVEYVILSSMSNYDDALEVAQVWLQK